MFAEALPGIKKKLNYTSIQTTGSTNYNIVTKGTLLKTKDNLLLSSLYLQKVTKYLHYVNLSDLDITNNNVNNTFLNLHYTFQNKLIGLNYVLFFMNNNKFNVIDNNTLPFLNKEKRFYKCVNTQQLTKTNYYLLDSNTLKSLTFLFQNEFNNTIKQNLNLGKENKWLMKNTLLSYDIITKNLSTTHLKKLYGNPQFNSDASNVNI